MAFEEKTDPRTYKAGSDLRTTGRYRFGVGANSSGETVVNVAGTQGLDVIGVIDDAVNTGEAVRVIVSGTAQVIAAAAITAGAKVATDNQGRAITAASTNKIVGIAREAATATGDIIAIELKDSAAPAP